MRKQYEKYISTYYKNKCLLYQSYSLISNMQPKLVVAMGKNRPYVNKKRGIEASVSSRAKISTRSRLHYYYEIYIIKCSIFYTTILFQCS